MRKAIMVDFTHFDFKEIEVDNSKLIDDLYYKTNIGPIVYAYIYPIEEKEIVIKILNQMKQIKKEYDDKFANLTTQMTKHRLKKA